MIPLLAVLALACGRSAAPETPAAPVSPAPTPPIASPATPPPPAEAAPTGTAAPEPTAWTPTDAQAAMIRELSLRDGSPPCATVEALSADPVADLTAIVAHVELPPAAPMRAAGCLVAGHAEAAEPTITAWVADPHTKGLALMVAGDLAVMPRPIAARVASAGLAGPHAEDVRRRILTAPDAEIRALAEVPHAP